MNPIRAVQRFKLKGQAPYLLWATNPSIPIPIPIPSVACKVSSLYDRLTDYVHSWYLAPGLLVRAGK